MAILLTVAAVFSACGKDEKPGPSKPAPPPRAALQLGEVKALDAKDRPEAAAKANEQAAVVTQALNAFYDHGFVDPSKFQAGAHPGLAGLFTAEAQPQVGPNLGGLALAELAVKVRKIDVTVQKIDKLSFLIEDDLSASSAIATVTFQGAASTKAKADGPVDITHKATFLLTPEGGTYKIAAFFAELKADTRTKKAAFGSLPYGAVL